MGLYDSVDRGKPKPKRLTGPIALCCALFLLFGGLTYWACHYQFRFHAFISDLTDSTRDARSTETFRGKSPGPTFTTIGCPASSSAFILLSSSATVFAFTP